MFIDTHVDIGRYTQIQRQFIDTHSATSIAIDTQIETHIDRQYKRYNTHIDTRMDIDPHTEKTLQRHTHRQYIVTHIDTSMDIDTQTQA